MSLLVCSLCEQNRTPVTKTVEEAIQALGKLAKGKNEFLANCVCDACGSREKKFTYRLELNTWGNSFLFVVEMNSEGEYTIRPRNDYVLAQKEYNHLALINMVKEQIDSLLVADARGLRLFSKNQIHAASGTPIVCVCGGDLFSNVKLLV
jgi:hypothetical protein